MAYDNNFGSNPDAGWNLSEEGRAILGSMSVYANDEHPAGNDASFDDMFDDSTYRANQSTFHRRGHALMPQGQTHDKKGVEYGEQGIPISMSAAHWQWLPRESRRR